MGSTGLLEMLEPTRMLFPDPPPLLRSLCVPGTSSGLFLCPRDGTGHCLDLTGIQVVNIRAWDSEETPFLVVFTLEASLPAHLEGWASL